MAGYLISIKNLIKKYQKSMELCEEGLKNNIRVYSNRTAIGIYRDIIIDLKKIKG